MPLRSEAVKAKAQELGFNLVGITRAAPSPFLDAYERWIEAGMHGSMGYMARPDRIARRRDLSVILPGVRSLVIVGCDYSADAPQAALRDPSRGRIASYAWGVDYHDIMLPMLEELADWIDQTTAAGGALLPQKPYRAYVDTGALLERGHAWEAGLGFVGKNTMLIHPRRGSYFFLGELLLGEDFDRYDTPGRATLCGSCTRCLSACPTDAFPAPYILDARRCISYLTIEHKGWIDRALRPRMGNWVYGCDVCQEVCPFQRFAARRERAEIPYGETAHLAPVPADSIAPALLDLLALTPNVFAARFFGSPIGRIGRDRLVRNACIAAGNWGSADAVPALVTLLDDASPLVRGHAAWALGRIGGEQARGALEAAERRGEKDAVAHEEIAFALTAEGKPS